MKEVNTREYDTETFENAYYETRLMLADIWAFLTMRQKLDIVDLRRDIILSM